MKAHDLHRQPPRIVIFTSPNHFYGNHLAKRILERNDVCEVVAVVLSTALLPNMTYVRALWKYFRKAGARFFVLQSLKALIFRVGCRVHHLIHLSNTRSPFFYFERITSSRQIPTLRTHDINAPSSREFVASHRPDLIVILLFGQILSAETLRIPSGGCINFHPSYLPMYRGLMPVFWVLANGERRTGATIHHVDESIDTGHIVDRIEIPIRQGDTEHSLYARICRHGADMMLRVIADIGAKEPIPPGQAQDQHGSYHSIPTKDAVARFRKNGRRFFTLTELRKAFESY